MYSISLQRDFQSEHFLIGGDWGPENELHAHTYRAILILRGDTLNEHGYLVDLVDVQDQLDNLIDAFEGRVLNNLPPFNNLNPSLEHFARIMARRLASQLDAPNVIQIEIQLWENELAWASFQCDLPCKSDW
ncbi:MAG: 6-carboxytetrahydropterin synthase [Anaerolineales bacterium]